MKAIFHCIRFAFAHAGGANITQLSMYLPNLCIFCPPECSRTRHESRTTFNFLGVPGRLIFHVIKIGRSARTGKATAMENGLKAVFINVRFARAGEAFIVFGAGHARVSRFQSPLRPRGQSDFNGNRPLIKFFVCLQETARKFITAKLSIFKPGSSSVLIIIHI
jgi:hypothetical protein